MFEGSSLVRRGDYHSGAEKERTRLLAPAPPGNLMSARAYANFRSLMASEFTTCPPTRLVA